MARGAERRRQILDAALDCFVRQGFDATTIEDIRAASGASTGSIYHFFGGKEAIAAELYLDVLRDYHEGLVAAVEATASAEEAVKAAVRHHLRWSAAHPDRARYLLATRRLPAVAASEGRIREVTAGFVQKELALLQPYVQRGEIARVPRAVLAALLFGPAQELVRLWLGQRGHVDLEAAEPLLAEAAWKVLRAR